MARDMKAGGEEPRGDMNSYQLEYPHSKLVYDKFIFTESSDEVDV
jgi:hypothetical protein